MSENEAFCPAEAVMARARRLMPSVEVAIMPNVHHVAAVALPEPVNAQVLDFLDPGDLVNGAVWP